MAADVCARAGDWPEALKALQQLVHLIYPALAAQEAALAAAEAAAAAGDAAREPAGPPGLARGGGATAAPAGSSSSTASSRGSGAAAAAAPAAAAWGGEEDAAEEEWAALAGGMAALDDAVLAAALQQRRFQRWPEAAGALAAYFCCVQGPGGGRLDTLATLRRLPRPLLATPDVQAALALAAALVAGDYVRLFRLRAAAPPLVRLVAGAVAGAARERALVALAAAYRNIAVAAVCRALALDARGLLACLKLLADRWVWVLVTGVGACWGGVQVGVCRLGRVQGCPPPCLPGSAEVTRQRSGRWPACRWRSAPRTRTWCSRAEAAGAWWF